MIKAKRSLASNGRIAPAEDLKLTKALLIANEAVTVFHGRVKRLEDCDCVIECPGKPCEGCCFSSFRDPATRAELTVMLNNVTSAIDDLNNQGVLGVTDSVSRERLARFIATIKAAIAVFSGI
ncbi:MAG: hypothetical protein H7Z16_03355 [Pyrinomonadaceae bacterium]|nr:hypothetical protein [Pyrinomonadaceae bacterium]